MQKNYFMQLAIKQAKLAFEIDEVPVGAIIVENNQIIAQAHNYCQMHNNATAHCELIAIEKACKIKNSRYLSQCDIYITLEPCLMCFGAISLARIRRIFFGANDEKFGAISNNFNFSSPNLAYHKPEIYGGIGAEESIELLQKFFQVKRLNNAEI
jgi:tRNA(Arg) A34 adenosine deaminase TadA